MYDTPFIGEYSGLKIQRIVQTILKHIEQAVAFLLKRYEEEYGINIKKVELIEGNGVKYFMYEDEVLFVITSPEIVYGDNNKVHVDYDIRLVKPLDDEDLDVIESNDFV